MNIEFPSYLEECRAYGANGTDIQQCSSMGGSISCVDCDRFFNVKRDMCPVMCGLCDRTYIILTYNYMILSILSKNELFMNDTNVLSDV